MTPLQRLQLRQSETRQSLNVVAGVWTSLPTSSAFPKWLTLTTSMQNLEVEISGGDRQPRATRPSRRPMTTRRRARCGP